MKKKRLIADKYSVTVDMTYENTFRTDAKDEIDAIMNVHDDVERDYPHQPPADS